MSKPRPKDRASFPILCPWQERLMATAAPRETGTGIPVVPAIRDCFHLYLSCLTLVIASPPFLAETRTGSISPLLKCYRWLPLPPEPRPNSLASSPSRTGTCGTFWCHLHHFTPVRAKYHPSPKCWVSFPISEPLCPPASLPGCLSLPSSLPSGL